MRFDPAVGAYVPAEAVALTETAPRHPQAMRLPRREPSAPATERIVAPPVLPVRPPALPPRAQANPPSRRPAPSGSRPVRAAPGQAPPLNRTPIAGPPAQRPPLPAPRPVVAPAPLYVPVPYMPYPPRPMAIGRPGVVTAAGVVLITTASLCALVTAWMIVAIAWLGQVYGGIARDIDDSVASDFDRTYWGTMTPWMVFQIVTLAVCAVALAYGIALLRGNRRSTQIMATVMALLLIVSWLPGIAAVIAVPILLWAPESARRWFGARLP